MTHGCKENESQNELLFDDLSDAPNSTCDENEFGDSSNIPELSDAIRHRSKSNKKYNTKCKLKMYIYGSYCLPSMLLKRTKICGPWERVERAERNVLRALTVK